MDKLLEITDFLEKLKPEEVYRVLAEQDQCMGDITSFWDGKSDFTKSCQYVLLGVPEDKGIVNMGGPAGAYEGPNAFRRAFYRLSNYFQKPAGLLVDIGNVRIDLDSDISSTHNKLTEIISFLVTQKIFPIVIGGGSDLTYAAVRGLHKSGLYKKLGIISFDAHLDLHDVPDRFIAGAAMKKIMDEFPDFIQNRNILYFGARKENVSPYANRLINEKNIRVFYKDTIGQFKNDLLFALNTAQASTDGIVMSFDLDSCDAGMMPGTSFPMPGGFSSEEIIEIAKALSKYKMSVYLDIVELNPKVDTNDITSVMAALFMFHFLEKR